MDHLSVVYAGTPEFAVPALRALLHSTVDVRAVYTQPDRPSGRGRKLIPGPVKALALEYGIAVEQPQSFRPEAIETLRHYQPDLMIVAAYGLILPVAVLAVPRLGCVNIHASLLPRWRGAAPIQRAILAGDIETGVCLMQMEAGLDTGPVLAERRVAIGAEQTAAELHDVLAQEGADLLAQQLPALAAAELTPQSQDEAMASYAAKLNKAEAWLDWSQPAHLLHRQIRAFNPWPVAQTRLAETVMRIWRASVSDAGSVPAVEPGRVLKADAGGIRVATGKGVLNILELQRPGGKILPAADFLNAVDLQTARFT